MEGEVRHAGFGMRGGEGSRESRRGRGERRVVGEGEGGATVVVVRRR